MKNIITYLATLSLIIVAGKDCINTPVASQNIPIYEPLEYDPPNNGAPPVSSSASVSPRGCPDVDKPFTALIPKDNTINTIAEYPTFWFYFPYKEGTVNLVIESGDANNPVADVTYEIKQGEGIISITLPKNMPGLELNRTYNWRVEVTCKPGVEASGAAASGVIQRVTTDEYLITHSSIKERIRLYAKQGLWAEAITTLIEARKFNPADQELQQNWSDLLSDPNVSLDEFISEPLVE